MAPTTDEELKLRLYSGHLSHLGPAEQFLKVMVEIPFAFKRLESLLFMSTLQDEVSTIKESFATLEVCAQPNPLMNYSIAFNYIINILSSIVSILIQYSIPNIPLPFFLCMFLINCLFKRFLLYKYSSLRADSM